MGASGCEWVRVGGMMGGRGEVRAVVAREEGGCTESSVCVAHAHSRHAPHATLLTHHSPSGRMMDKYENAKHYTEKSIEQMTERDWRNRPHDSKPPKRRVDPTKRVGSYEATGLVRSEWARTK